MGLSSIHTVPKGNGEWRPCGDYRRLNQRTMPDRYPIPSLTDCTSKLAGFTIFSKIDLFRGYFQVPVHPDSIPKTAIVTPFGSFEFLRMSFGLRNAAQTFMKLMHKALHGLDFIFIYMDDFLLFSRSMDVLVPMRHHHFARKFLYSSRDWTSKEPPNGLFPTASFGQD